MEFDTKIKPILFSTPMIQAIKMRLKTQTRRVVKEKSDAYKFLKCGFTADYVLGPGNEDILPIKRGDILWVRETFFDSEKYKNAPLFEGKNQYIYKADGCDIGCHQWRPSIFMPKDACRIFLRVVDVTIERLHSIHSDDAIAEGIETTWIHDDPRNSKYKNYINDGNGSLSPIGSYKSLWNSINGPESWDANPWVWVYEFEVMTAKNFNELT